MVSAFSIKSSVFERGLGRSLKLNFSFFGFFKIFNRIGILKGYYRRMALNALTRDYVTLKGIYQSLVDGELKFDDPKRAYLGTKRVVMRYIGLSRQCRELGFFGSKELEEAFTKTLQLFYSIEAELKIIAHRDRKPLKTDDGLRLALSSTSKRALASKMGPL